MIQTYDIQETLGIDLEGSNLPKTRAREVEKAFQDFFGITVNLVDRMTETPANWFEIESDDVGINPQMSGDALEFVRNGMGFWSVQEVMKDYFGESQGSSNVTGEVVEHDLSVRQVIVLLSESGDLKKAVKIARERRTDDDPSAEFLVAFAIWRYALGWDAEKILTYSGDFRKGNTAQDEGGIDGWWLGTRRQIKAGTEVTSKGRGTLMNRDVPHAGYIWNSKTNELVIADMEDYLQMVDEVAESVGLKYKTHLHDSERLASDDDRLRGRPFRYVWY